VPESATLPPALWKENIAEEIQKNIFNSIRESIILYGDQMLILV
jgi:hypothetical protein